MTQIDAPSAPNVRRGLLGRGVAWLFSPKHFHFKLLSGTAVGIVVITFLAGLFLFVTLRNHHQETLRAHTLEVMRLTSVIENDIAALETGHRGYLLTADGIYLESFERRRELIKRRVEDLTQLILDSPRQRKRVMKIQEIVQKWLDTVARPQMNGRQAKNTPPLTELAAAGTGALGTTLLNQAREILQSLQSEEQIVLNERMREQEWAAQSTQILDFLTKMERSVIEMQKEKRGYLITGENDFAEAYKRATADFYTYHGYLSILIANSPEQSQSLGEIKKAVEKWATAAATPEMEAKRTGKDLEALMTDIREMLTKFQTNEVNLYESRSSTATRERIIKTMGLALLCVFAVGLLIVSNSYSFVLVRRQLAKLEGIETRIRSIIENILDGMITVDEQGIICSMNPSAEKMFGCINNEMVGHKFTKLVPKSYGAEPEPVACAWDDLARRTGSTTMAVGRTRRHATFPIEISLSEMVVDKQKLFVAMVRDVTERRRFEQEIAADKESLAVTLRSIEDGVITTDVQGKIIMINNAGENLTGWSSKEAIGQPLKSVYNIAIDLAAQARAQKSGSRNEAQSILLSMPENATLKSR
ncbi:MAG: ammonium transporter, Amt family, partial [Verrucomicrobiota bacterium]